jgi:ABC-2 type transport system permease protein
MRKTIREVWAVTVLLALMVATFEALLAFIVLKFDQGLFGQWLQLEMVQAAFKAMLGSEVGESVGPGVMASVPWVHPVVLALVWAQGILLGTRVPAGEVDRGTIDVLLGLPVTRARIYQVECAVWLACGLVVVSMGVVGNVIGGLSAAPEARIAFGRTVLVAVNLYCLYVAVGGMACMVSSLSDRRGRAVGIVFAIVLASYLLNSIAQLWGPAKSARFLSVLNYYKPLPTLRGGAFPVTDMLVLVGIGAVLWMIGGLIFARRDICTV